MRELKKSQINKTVPLLSEHEQQSLPAGGQTVARSPVTTPLTSLAVTGIPRRAFLSPAILWGSPLPCVFVLENKSRCRFSPQLSKEQDVNAARRRRRGSAMTDGLLGEE